MPPIPNLPPWRVHKPYLSPFGKQLLLKNNKVHARMRYVRISDLIIGMQITSVWHHILHRRSSYILRGFLPTFLHKREAKRNKVALYSAQSSRCLTGAMNFRWARSSSLASVDVTQFHKVVAYSSSGLTAVKYKISR
jgi:hypothetical protein